MSWPRYTRRCGSDSGQVLLLTAFSMTVLFGMAALSVDASFMYDKRNRLYSAADAGAKSGAIEVNRNSSVSQSALEAFADQAAARHGFQSTRSGGTASIVVNHPPVVSTLYAGNVNYVEVIASEPSSTFFGSIFARFNMTPGARAVAGTGSSPYCLITLDDANPSLEIGNSTITTNGCAVETSGPISGSNPNAEIVSEAVSVAGGCSGTCDGFSNLHLNAPPPSDPLAGKVPTPPACSPVPLTVNGGAWPAGCYSNVTINGVVTLTGGTYQIYGTVRFENNTEITMSPNTGFMYFGPAAVFDFGQRSTLQVTAATTGPYKAIAVYIDPGNTSDWEMNNHSGVEVTGAFYAPNTNVSFDNHLNTSSDCTLFVVGTLDIKNGNGVMGNQCSAYGGSPLTTISLAE